MNRESDDCTRIPVIIGVGEICDRPAIETEGLDSIGLMVAALHAAQQDAGVALLDKIDWLGVEDQISFPMPAPQDVLGSALPALPPRRVKTAMASGDGPVLLLNDAANLIARGTIRIAAIAGGEALRTAAKRATADVAAGREPPRNSVADIAAANALPLARKYGLLSPIDAYPLYENAMRAAWGQTLDEAQHETAEIWSGFSQVASANPNAWMREPLEPAVIAQVSADNRMVSFPYTKLMVANAAVNMGAAVFVTSLAVARELGVADDRIVYIGAGAAAHESDDFLKRDVYTRLASLDATVGSALASNGLNAGDLDHVELYSCFPCVPKAARRVLGWPLDRAASVYGGLTFGGGPIGNCMMHAIAQMTHRLRQSRGNGLIVANGGYATHSHSIILRGLRPMANPFPQDYNVQPVADRQRDAAPVVLDAYEGVGTIETYTVPFDRKGQPVHATVLARTPAGERFVAKVPATDTHTLGLLLGASVQVIGSEGQSRSVDGINVWSSSAGGNAA